MKTLDSYTQQARCVYAGALVFLGLLHVLVGENLTRMLPAWPEGLPGRPLWSRGIGVLLAAAAWNTLVGTRARASAVVVAFIMFAAVLTLHLPRALPTGDFTDPWLNVLKWSAMAAGAFVVGSVSPAPRPRSRTDDILAAGTRLAPWILAAFMMGSAILHVRFADIVADLMQPWIPLRLFWTYAAALALAAGSLGLISSRTRPIAALLTSMMIFSWFLIVHTPRMLMDPQSPVGWSEMAEALAFSAFAYLLAAGTSGNEPS